MWSKHQLSEPIVCNRGNCGGRSYSSAFSLRQHIRTIHQGQYKFNCDKCDYGTDSYDCLTSHRVHKHKEKLRTPKGKLLVFTCKKCKKEFDAPHLLRKHESNASCTKKKTIPAQIAQGSTRPRRALHTTRSSSTRGRKPHAPFVGRWFQRRPCPTTRNSIHLRELSRGPKTLWPKPKGGRELLLSPH